MSSGRMKKRNISIILPSLNEELTIGKVIDEIPRQLLEEEGYQVEVVVIDNNSRDRTRQAAQAKGARVIIEPRRGKGRAVRAALASVRADFVFMLDAELFTQLAKTGYRIAEAPVYYRRREGKTKLSQITDGIKIGWMLIARRF